MWIMEAWLSIPPIALVFSAIQSLQFNTSHSIPGILKLEYSKRPLHGVLGFARSGVQFAQLCNLHNRAIPAGQFNSRSAGGGT